MQNVHDGVLEKNVDVLEKNVDVLKKNDDKFNDRSKNLSVAIYTAGSVALCVLIFSSIGLLLIKTNSGDNNSNEINEAFEPNDDVLFKEKDEIIEITFNDNDSTI